jgi:carboxyl-terminal processing protease
MGDGRRVLKTALVFVVVMVVTAQSGTPREGTDPGRAVVTREEALADFDSAWSRIANSYYDPTFAGRDWAAVREAMRPLAQAAATRGELRTVLRRMLATLGESHFALIPQEVADAYSGERGVAAGAGIVPLHFRVVEDRLVVSGGGSADGQPVRSGWIVDSIGPHDVTAWLGAVTKLPDAAARKSAATGVVRQAESLLEGEPGSRVAMRFQDESGRPVAVELVRVARAGVPVRLGNLPTVFALLEHERIPLGRGCAGVIRFNQWMTDLVGPFERALDELASCDGIVVDLRGNGGGVGAMVMVMSGFFLDSIVPLGVVHTRQGQVRYFATPQRTSATGDRRSTYKGRVAVMVDGLSASTSEIFAIGMQQVGRARIFGETSAGQALPAQMVRLPGGDVLYHAIADLTAPDGSRIEGHGTVPDEIFPLTRADLLAGRDPALEAALRWIGARDGRDGALEAGQLPDAATVIERYIVALGGRAAMLRPRSVRITGTLEIPAAGMKGSFETLLAAPDRLLRRITLPGIGEFRTGYDGDAAWSIDPVAGARLVESGERAGVQAQAWALAAVRDESLFESRVTEGVVEIEGQRCYRVALSWKNGRESRDCYAADTGLLVATLAVEETPMGPVEVLELLGGYSDFGGILRPLRAVQRMLGQEQVFTTVMVEYDVVEAGAFVLPPEISALRRSAPASKE